NVPLTIASVKPSCQCTVTEYSTEAIAPGESGYVMARYSAASPGFFNKSVTVRLNVEGELVILKLSGQVMPDESGD
ncbi:MAG: DUF1573 domain-containing protein, partial [Bacteroidia bacterium]|nr:DUF1573 domain-containing protein [Bacteroidia bacterium]